MSSAAFATNNNSLAGQSFDFAVRLLYSKQLKPWGSPTRCSAHLPQPAVRHISPNPLFDTSPPTRCSTHLPQPAVRHISPNPLFGGARAWRLLSVESRPGDDVYYTPSFLVCLFVCCLSAHLVSQPAHLPQPVVRHTFFEICLES
jgi:hypothetical protein